MAATRLRIAVREFPDFEHALSQQIELYQKLHPEVEIEAVPLDLCSLRSKLFEEDGLCSGEWDIAFIVTDWLAEAVERKLIDELTLRHVAKPIPDWPHGWASSLVRPLDFNGKLYALPWHDGPECFIYRRNLLEDPIEQEKFRNSYGYPLAPPTTWTQFSDIAHFFTRPAENLYGTLFAAFPDGHNTLYDFALQLWSRGGELESSNGTPQINTPQAVRSLDFYRGIIGDASRCYPGAEELDSTRSGNIFLSGTIAMMVNWFGFATRCDSEGASLRGKVAIAPIPSEEGIPPASLSVFWTLAIASGSKQKEVAYDFIRFVASPEMDLGVVAHGVVGVRLSTWRNAEVQKRIPAYSKIEEISLGARALPRSSHLPAFAEILNDVVTDALQTQQPSAEILSRAQQRIASQKIMFR